MLRLLREMRQTTDASRFAITSQWTGGAETANDQTDRRAVLKNAFLLLLFVASIGAWCQPTFAQQSVVGAIPTPLNATGVTSGVAMTGQGGGGTLTVGVVGGPEMDIFTNNSSGGNVTNPLLPAVTTDASSLSNITFNSSSTVFGTIGVTPLASPLFLNLSGGNNGATDNFQGNVDATQLTVSGTGSVNFNSGSTNNITRLIYGADGTIGLAPNTTVNGAVTTTAGANTGTLSLGGGSVLNGAVGGAIGLRAINVVGGSNIAGVSANITGAVDAFSFSLGTNTLSIGGALTIANQGPAGTIATTLSSPTVFGNIVAGGRTNLGTLAITVNVPSTAVFPVGTDFTIVQSGGTGTAGITATAIDPTNPLYTFAQVATPGSTTPGPTNATGFIVITTTGIPLAIPIVPPAVPLPPTLPIAAPIAPIIIAVAPTLPSSSTLFQAAAAISALTTPAAVVNAIAQLAPSTSDLAAPLVTFQGTQQFQNAWLSRMDDAMCGEINQRKPDEETSVCRRNDPQSGWWVRAFGYFGGQDAQGAFSGYDSQIVGTMAAFDAPVFRDESFGIETRVGVGIGYARSNIDGKTFNTNTNFDTYQVTAYVSHETGPWFVQGDASFGWNNYSGTRNISFPGINLTANAGYSGQSYTYYANTGYHFYSQSFTITPIASLQYTRVNLNGYTESGAGDVDLKIASQRYDFLESGLGVKVARPFVHGAGTYVPETHFKWLHEINNPTLKNSAAFTAPGSGSFATPGLTTADDTFNVGAGLTFLSCSCSANTWSLEAVYDYYGRTDGYSAHQGMLKFTSRF